MIDRLTEKVFAFLDNPEPVIDWLKTLGCKDVVQSEPGSWALTGLTGIRCGLVQADPITVATQFGFLLAGPYWPQVYRGLHKAVDKRWTERRKKGWDWKVP